MHIRIRHISLVLGILLIIFSFLFFGRDQRIYGTMILIGMLLSGFSFIWILFKDPKKQKSLWLAIVILSVLIQRLSESFLINYSYKIFVDQNIKLLSDVNQIMQSKAGNIFYSRSLQQDTEKFNSKEIEIIRQLFAHTSIYLIFKDNEKVYYGTYGRLAVRLGIFYFYTPKLPDQRFRRIQDKWYY